MRIYVAAPWLRKPDAIAFANRLRALGHEITSRWFEHEGDPNDSTGAKIDIEEIRQQAQQDIEDVRRAEAIIVLNLQKSEGKAVETGIAITSGIPVISVGSRSNIFQALGLEVATEDEAIAAVQAGVLVHP